MKILLTGATGFIGSHLLRALIKEKHDVTIIKRSFSKIDRIKDCIGQCKEFNINEYEPEVIFNSPYDVFMHLSTYYRKEHKYEDISEMINSNVILPSLFLEQAIKSGIKYFVNTGTFFQEELPNCLYTQTKIAFENILKMQIANNKIKGVTLKLFSPYGEDDNQDKIIPLAIKALLKGEEFEVKNKEVRLDFNYVEDIVNYYVFILSYLNHYNNYENKDVRSWRYYSLCEMVDIIKKIINKQDTFNYPASLIRGLKNTIEDVKKKNGYN